MAGQYSESSKLSFPWSLFGGSFRHLFVAILDRMRPNDRVFVFAMGSTRFGLLKTILKRSSNDPQMPAYWFLQGIVQVLTCSKRTQTLLKRSSNAHALVFAMDSTRFDVLRTILKRSSNDPQTILKRWRTGFCNIFYKF